MLRFAMVFGQQRTIA